MAIQTLDTIKEWFKTGLKPKQQQFWDTWDSFRHKYEKVPVQDIEGIDELLFTKADKAIFEDHVTLAAELNKTLNETKENVSNKSLTLSPTSTDNDYPSSKTVYKFINEFVKPHIDSSAEEVLDLVNSNSLIPGNYYLINDFQTIYKINGSDSAPIANKRKINSFVSNYALLDLGSDPNLLVGKAVIITKLPEGYSGSLAVGSTTTVSVVSQSFYFRFANGMQNIIGLEFEYTLPRYSNGTADNLIVNDSNGKPVIRPGGVLNTEVHDGSAYMDMLATENQNVPLESIILKAKSKNEFELEGKSLTYPDDIIEYRLPIAGAVSKKGTILRRYNRSLNIDLKVDWRVQRYRRWKISPESILKILNQDQPVTSLTGFANVYQFTATKSSTTTPERFYIASDLDSKSKTIDADTKIIDFTMDVSSTVNAKDFTIFKLDSNHQPVNIKMMKVSGSFNNTVVQNNLGETNHDTNIDAEALNNTTFVCSAIISGSFTQIYDSLFLDTLQISPLTKSSLLISKTKSLSYLQIIEAISSAIYDSVIGVNSNNYSGAPNPSVRWSKIDNIQGSILEKTLLGGSLSSYNFNNSNINNTTLFFYYNYKNDQSTLYNKLSEIIFNNCLLLSMSIFNRAKSGNIIFNNVISNVNYLPPSLSGRDVYINSNVLTEVSIQMNKYNHRLFYEERDASDTLTMNTYATPVT